MAKHMPKTLVGVTGFRNMNNDTLTTAIRLLALATAYVSGETVYNQFLKFILSFHQVHMQNVHYLNEGC